MPADQELLLIFGALHLLALVFGGLLLAMFFHSEALPAWRPPEDEDDGGEGLDGGQAPDAHTFRLPA